MEQLIQPQTEFQGLNIYQRIVSVMKEVDYIAKGDKTVNGQYRFVSHDAVTAKIHPMLVKNGIAVIPTVEECTQDNNRTKVKLAVVFRNIDNPNDAFVVYHYGYGVDNSDKGIGKAVSYAFKYALLKTFCLETGDDPDNETKTLYEPPRCLEFDNHFKDATGYEKVLAFVEKTANQLNKHPEDVKREALQRMPEFLAAVAKWNPKKKD